MILKEVHSTLLQKMATNAKGVGSVTTIQQQAMVGNVKTAGLDHARLATYKLLVTTITTTNY